jgi:hypothetical protein
MSPSFEKRSRSRPETHAELTSYWSSLRHMSPQNGILRFPDYCYLELDYGKGLYVRRAYEDLFALISKDLNPKDPKDQLHRFTITGTPGTGKGTFLFYLLWRLANMEAIKTVIFRQEDDLGCIYVFQHDRCWETFDYDDIDELLDDSASWYLVDSCSSRPAEVKAITVFVTSVKLQHDMYYSYSAAAQPYYLPVWSLEELKMAASLSKTSVKVVEERYSLIGGIPRYVLVKHFNIKREIDRLIYALAGGFFEFVLEAKSDEFNIGHFIIHYQVNSTYSDYSLVFSSKYVASLALKRLLTARLVWQPIPVPPGERLRRVLFPMKSSPDFFGLQANLFEYLAHRLLSIGGKFVGRSLDDGTVLELNVPRRNPKMFHDLSECIDPNVYYVPWSWNHSCIDSVVLNMGCFRMSMTAYPAISEGEMQRIAEELKVDKFYFVVPDCIFERFGRQTLAEMEECRDTTVGSTVKGQEEQEQMLMMGLPDTVPNFGERKEQEVTMIKDGEDPQTDFLRQYVICIPFEEDWKNICHVLESTSDFFEEKRPSSDEKEGSFSDEEEASSSDEEEQSSDEEEQSSDEEEASSPDEEEHSFDEEEQSSDEEEQSSDEEE